MYLFLLDFLKYYSLFINEEDYNIISGLLRRLFSEGGCLMPYPVFSSNKFTLGLSTVMGDVLYRSTEGDEPESRITESDIIRTLQ